MIGTAATATTTWARVVGRQVVHTIVMIAGVSPCSHTAVVVAAAVVASPAADAATAGTTAIVALRRRDVAAATTTAARVVPSHHALHFDASCDLSYL